QGTSCHFYWVESDVKVPTEIWEFVRWRHDILSYGSPGGLCPSDKELREFEEFRHRIIDSNSHPRAQFEMSEDCTTCLWLSPTWNEQNLRHLDRLSDKAVNILGPHFA